ncbi:MAG: hypothetical protein LBV22_01310 [Mycoplasmataceae bacterium]|jgi:uncharacterized membrane protein|nr:hypothetical protein [Mycoplasmataceae bacterium]
MAHNSMERTNNERAVEAVQNSDIVSDPFYSNAYLKAFSGNLVRKVFCVFIILLNICVFALVFIGVIYVCNAGKIPFIDKPLPSFFENFMLLDPKNPGKLSVYGHIVIIGSAALILVDIILLIMVLSFGSMRSHIKKLESTKL